MYTQSQIADTGGLTMPSPGAEVSLAQAILQSTRQSAIYTNAFFVILLLVIAPTRHFAFNLPLFPSPLSAFLEWGIIVPCCALLAYIRWARCSVAITRYGSVVLILSSSLALLLDIHIWNNNGIPIPHEYTALFFLSTMTVAGLRLPLNTLCSVTFLTCDALMLDVSGRWNENSGFLFYFDVVAVSITLLLTLALERETKRAWAFENDLRTMAFHDSLTGLANRRFLSERAASTFLQARREACNVGVALLDINDFKKLNDSQGHAAGDEALKKVAQLLKKSAARPMDTAARVGGDEFVLLLYDCTADHLQATCKTLREQVQALNIRNPDAARGLLSVSVGGAIGVPSEQLGYEQFLHRADIDMYARKKADTESTMTISRL